MVTRYNNLFSLLMSEGLSNFGKGWGSGTLGPPSSRYGLVCLHFFKVFHAKSFGTYCTFGWSEKLFLIALMDSQK